MTEDNLCGIQKKYGAEYLSKVCATYPRRIFNFYKIYECVLSLSCPIAAELILLADEPLKLETVKIPKNVHSGYMINSLKFNSDTVKYMIEIQKTAIFILQERNLTIDRRFFMLGLYLDKLNESAFNGVMTSSEFEKLNEIYKNTNFLQEQSANFAVLIKFNVQNYIKIMLELFNSIFGEQEILNSIGMTLKSEKYISLSLEREKFLQKFSTIFENYLVNELLFNLYPFRFEGNISLSYGVFVTTYKMLELLTFAMAVESDFTEKDLVRQIIYYANKIDHNTDNFEKISDYIKDKSDIVEIMQDMLQV